MTALPRIDIAKPMMGAEELAQVAEVLESGWLTQGPKVAAFERAFAARHAAAHGVAVTSCTTGLHLVMAALGIGPGDEVVVPSFSWVASANTVLQCGATPVLCDVDPDTFNIRVDDALSRVTSRTKAVMAVHLFGLCADTDGLRAGLPPQVVLIEDAACAAGASLGARPAGSLGTAGVFSFHPRKVITTGEGGMVTTNDPVLAEKMAVLRNHGASIPEEQRHHGPKPHLLPDFAVAGFNYRMTDLQGAVGLAQLARLDGLMEERARRASAYGEALSSIGWLRPPCEPQAGRHGWQSYVCRVLPDAPLSAADLMDRLEALGIATRPGTHAIHTLDYYRRRFGHAPGDLPGALAAATQSIALPLHGHMSDDDYDRVTSALRSV